MRHEAGCGGRGGTERVARACGARRELCRRRRRLPYILNSARGLPLRRGRENGAAHVEVLRRTRRDWARGPHVPHVPHVTRARHTARGPACAAAPSPHDERGVVPDGTLERKPRSGKRADGKSRGWKVGTPLVLALTIAAASAAAWRLRVGQDVLDPLPAEPAATAAAPPRWVTPEELAARVGDPGLARVARLSGRGVRRHRGARHYGRRRVPLLRRARRDAGVFHRTSPKQGSQRTWTAERRGDARPGALVRFSRNRRTGTRSSDGSRGARFDRRRRRARDDCSEPHERETGVRRSHATRADGASERRSSVRNLPRVRVALEL